MNGAERLQTALVLGIPDRVPHMELAYNESSIIGIARHFTDNVPAVNYFQRMTVEEKIKLFDALLLMGACLVCAFMALAMLTLTVAVPIPLATGVTAIVSAAVAPGLSVPSAQVTTWAACWQAPWLAVEDTKFTPAGN